MSEPYLVGGVRTPIGRYGGALVRYGLATMCVGVGQGTAMILERVDA